jgi:uncharacterized protein YbjQ (UPF0145 family)
MIVTTTPDIQGQTIREYLGIVVGVDIDYETIGNNMLMVSASGPAVKTG